MAHRPGQGVRMIPAVLAVLVSLIVFIAGFMLAYSEIEE